jgi:putative ABC transport system permease protein
MNNILRIALKALLRNKTRSLLTMLGIIIGIGSVIGMVSIGQSSSIGINNQISSMGSNMLFIMPGAQQKGGISMGTAAAQSLTLADVNAVSTSKYLSAVSPTVSAGGQLVNGSNNWRGALQGGNAEIFEIRKYVLSSGVPFGEYEVRTAAKVCVIGLTVVNNLFPNGESPIGKTIRFNKIPLKVIGVLESKGQNTMGQDQDDIVVVPYTTVQKRILAITHVQSIMASANSEDVAALASEDVTRIMRESHKIKSINDDDFNVRTQEEILKMMSSITGMLTILLAAIASISLVVGGIGIMNIMYVTVTERTKEIGLRMSIGAQKTDILKQFLAESIILCLIGGVVGILVGLLLSYVVSSALDWPFIVSVSSVVISFLVSATIGIFFGWYPARKASNMDPIVALRYE